MDFFGGGSPPTLPSPSPPRSLFYEIFFLTNKEKYNNHQRILRSLENEKKETTASKDKRVWYERVQAYKTVTAMTDIFKTFNNDKAGYSVTCVLLNSFPGI